MTIRTEYHPNLSRVMRRLDFMEGSTTRYIIQGVQRQAHKLGPRWVLRYSMLAD